VDHRVVGVARTTAPRWWAFERELRGELLASHLRHHDIGQQQVDRPACARATASASTPSRARGRDNRADQGLHGDRANHLLVLGEQDRLDTASLAHVARAAAVRAPGSERQVDLERRAVPCSLSTEMWPRSAGRRRRPSRGRPGPLALPLVVKNGSKICRDRGRRCRCRSPTPRARRMTGRDAGWERRSRSRSRRPRSRSSSDRRPASHRARWSRVSSSCSNWFGSIFTRRVAASTVTTSMSSLSTRRSRLSMSRTTVLRSITWLVTVRDARSCEVNATLRLRLAISASHRRSAPRGNADAANSV